MPKPAPDPLHALILLAAALACAVLANGLARPGRRLDWTGWTPPALPATAPAPGASAPAARPPLPEARGAAAKVPVPAARVAASAAGSAPPANPPPAARSSAPVAAPGADPGFSAAPGEPIRELASDAAWSAFQLGVPFLDARRSADFEAGHLAGAWSAPVWEATVTARITEFEARANPAPRAPIVIYCSGGDCDDSRLLAGKLLQLGYRNLFIYRDGFPDWERRGRPVARGARP